MSDVPFGELVDWLEGRLDAEAASRVAERVAAAGPETAQAVVWLRWMLAEVASPLEPPPPALNERLRHLFRAHQLVRQAAAEDELGTMELIFDSRRDPALAGVRGEGDSDAATESDDLRAVQLVFRHLSRGLDLVLDASVDEEAVRIDGQLLAADARQVIWTVVALQGAGTASDTATTDALGAFALHLTPGTSGLRLSDGATVLAVHLPPIGRHRGGH